MRKIAIFGAGGFGREVAMLIEHINQVQPTWQLIGFFDDGEPTGKIINGYPVIGGLTELQLLEEPMGLVFALGNPVVKKKVCEKVSNPLINYPTLIHPSVVMGATKNLKIGEGCIICAGNIITVNIEIGNHVILNLSCTVGHDTVIKDYCSFMPAVNISGEVFIHQCVYAGTGAKIINQLEIGENTVVGAGAVVSKSLPANCTAVGIPAKPIKFH